MAASRLPRLLVAALVVLLLLWGAALGVLLRNEDQFPADAAVDARLSARPGVNLAAVDLAPQRLDAVLASLAGQGIAFVRFTLPWDQAELAKGQFDWDAWDAVAAAFARQPGIEPVVVLDHSPVWARDPADGGNPLAPPHDRRDFGAFASAVAQRYGDRFTYYQVWDEPNIAPHWGTRPADPADYLGLLREAAVNVRDKDPNARIIAGALAPTTEAGGANLSDVSFLDQLYSLGGRAWFDYPAGQPYGYSTSPDAAPDPASLDFGRAALLRDVMVRHGDAGTPLWATSFGWAAEAGADSKEQNAAWGSVSAAQQATYTAAAFARAAGEWPWLGPLLWTARFPMLPATEQVLADAASPGADLGPGRHAADAAPLNYQGWRVTTQAADPNADGATLRFDFMGTGAALEVQGGPYWAYLNASVDGRPANRLPRDEPGASYLVLYDPSVATRLVPLAGGLPFGQHTVQLTAHGGWGQWPLRAVVVSGTPAGGRARPVGLGLAALALVATLVTAGLAWRWSRDRSGPHPAAASDGAGAGQGAAAVQTRSARITDFAIWILAIGLCALFLVSGSGWVSFVLLALLGLLFLARPDLAPPLIAASLPWWQRTQPVLRWQFALFEALAWVALLAWIARGVLARLTHRQAGGGGQWRLESLWARGAVPLSLDISMMALFSSGLLATLFATEQGVAWREFRIVFLFGLVLYLLVTRASRGPVCARVSALVLGLLAGATIASLAGLWQFVSGQGRVDVEGVGRIAGGHGAPNNLALILDRAVPLAAALALFGVVFWRSGTRGARLMRGVFAGIAAITLTAAVATFSKGALLLGLPVGLAVVLIGGAWRSRRGWPLWVLGALVVGGAAILAALFRTPRFADLFNFAGGTSFLRLKLWRGALNMGLDHPLLGVGPDNFLYAYRTRYVLPSGWQELNLSHPHNLVLDLWTRLGLIGVVAGLFSLIAVFVAGWREFVRGKSWPLTLGLLGGLAAGVAHGLIDNSLFLPDLMGWFVAAQAIFWLCAPELQGSGESANPTVRGQA